MTTIGLPLLFYVALIVLSGLGAAFAVALNRMTGAKHNLIRTLVIVACVAPLLHHLQRVIRWWEIGAVLFLLGFLAETIDDRRSRRVENEFQSQAELVKLKQQYETDLAGIREQMQAIVANIGTLSGRIALGEWDALPPLTMVDMNRLKSGDTMFLDVWPGNKRIQFRFDRLELDDTSRIQKAHGAAKDREDAEWKDFTFEISDAGSSIWNGAFGLKRIA